MPSSPFYCLPPSPPQKNWSSWWQPTGLTSSTHWQPGGHGGDGRGPRAEGTPGSAPQGCPRKGRASRAGSWLVPAPPAASSVLTDSSWERPRHLGLRQLGSSTWATSHTPSMHVCMYLCMHVCMCVCVCLSVHARVYLCSGTYLYACMST